ncbi:anhydro-N-acetylmuramic acid kinase [Leptolyngbya sp. PCC 6406]|uniref:anhydro-N-acetylmuramic acid kinase n=1 Tax=Leptolyngbya sp. PCC 6406 TaxID=1173264 RepID=UPI0002ACE116|nr:anhydro-N-acetylmuramic acid kinase [Leptolyngbya sp. PCC 6406]
MRVIGLISGTSVDGIDGAIAEIHGQGYQLAVTVLGGGTVAYPPEVQGAILRACAGEALTLSALADLDDAVAQCFAQAAQALVDQYGPVDLVASHGQTVFHRPPDRGAEGARRNPRLGYSLQLGRGAAISDQLQCLTVSNFRAADIAVGGEGAPLVPPIDAVLLAHENRDRCVQNIGGIGNVAYLPPQDKLFATPSPQVFGWDTGPGNSLLDLAVQTLSGGTLTFDQGGQWAAQGTPDLSLVETWLRHPYFDQAPPKSTGRELFGWDFWQQCQAQMTTLAPADVLATLVDFTAASIAQEYRRWLPQLPAEVLLCGGGSRNFYLRERLAHYLPVIPITTTDDLGVPSGLKEAIAFAVLGFWRHQGFPGNLPTVTGAHGPVVLGEIHYPTPTAFPFGTGSSPML